MTVSTPVCPRRAECGAGLMVVSSAWQEMGVLRASRRNSSSQRVRNWATLLAGDGPVWFPSPSLRPPTGLLLVGDRIHRRNPSAPGVWRSQAEQKGACRSPRDQSSLPQWRGRLRVLWRQVGFQLQGICPGLVSGGEQGKAAYHRSPGFAS